MSASHIVRSLDKQILEYNDEPGLRGEEQSGILSIACLAKVTVCHREGAENLCIGFGKVNLVFPMVRLSFQLAREMTDRSL